MLQQVPELNPGQMWASFTLVFESALPCLYKFLIISFHCIECKYDTLTFWAALHRTMYQLCYVVTFRGPYSQLPHRSGAAISTAGRKICMIYTVLHTAVLHSLGIHCSTVQCSALLRNVLHCILQLTTAFYSSPTFCVLAKRNVRNDTVIQSYILQSYNM